VTPPGVVQPAVSESVPASNSDAAFASQNSVGLDGMSVTW